MLRETTRVEAQSELLNRYQRRIDELKNIIVTGMGEVWHAGYLCARQRTQLVVYTRRPRRVCVQQNGRNDNGPPEGHTDDFPDIDGSWCMLRVFHKTLFHPCELLCTQLHVKHDNMSMHSGIHVPILAQGTWAHACLRSRDYASCDPDQKDCLQLDSLDFVC